MGSCSEAELEALKQKLGALKRVADRLEPIAARGAKRVREWECAQLRHSPTLEVLTGFASRLRTNPPPSHPLAPDTVMPLMEFPPCFGLPYPTNYDISQSVLGLVRAPPPIVARQSDSEILLRALPPATMIIFTIDGSEPLLDATRRTHRAVEGPCVSQKGIRYGQASEHREDPTSIVLPVKPGLRLLARATGPKVQVSVTIAVDIQVPSPTNMGTQSKMEPVQQQSPVASKAPPPRQVQPRIEERTEARARFADDLLLESDDSDDDD